MLDPADVEPLSWMVALQVWIKHLVAMKLSEAASTSTTTTSLATPVAHGSIRK